MCVFACAVISLFWYLVTKEKHIYEIENKDVGGSDTQVRHWLSEHLYPKHFLGVLISTVVSYPPTACFLETFKIYDGV